MIENDTAVALDAGLNGDLITPADARYDDARAIYNGMIDKRPGDIARCTNAADVVQAVNTARENRWTVSVLGGGHSGPGLGLCDDGLVIDLSAMKGVRVDPKGATARVEGGCTIGELDHATHAFGHAVPAGIVFTTGIGGLTLGGGHGYLTRKYGLTIDSLMDADVVLADGRLVTANAYTNEDLFWALRGGGGNFGVATSFLFRLHPVKEVHAGVTLWPMEKAREALQWYREFLPTASPDLYGFFAFLEVPPAEPFPENLHGKVMCGVVWCFTGLAKLAGEAFKPVRDFGPPVFEHLGPAPYTALQSMFDDLYPPGLHWYWKGDFVKEISDEAVDIHVKHGERLPSGQSLMHLYPIDGAVHSTEESETAFGYRDANWSMVIAGVDRELVNAGKITEWARAYWTELHPFTLGGAYVNFMMDEGEDRVKATYRGNYERLREVKTKYDPENLFRINQNNPPIS